MKFYVKNDKEELVEANQEQVLDVKEDLYNEEGEHMKRSNPSEDKDPIKELAGLVSDLTDTVKGRDKVKDETESLKEKLAAYQDAEKRGIVFPKIDTGMTVQEGDEVFKAWDQARQGRELTNKMLHPGYQISDENRKDLAKYFCTAIKALSPFNDPAAIAKMRADYVKTGGTDIGDSGNTFEVPDEVMSEILAFAREPSVVLKDARVTEMISDKQSFNAESSGVAVAWGNTTAESNPVSAEVELDSYELSAYSVARNDVLADSRSDIVSWITQAMAEATGLELDNSAFNGDGTSTYAGCSGMLTAACGYSVVMASGSTSFANISHGNLSNMLAALDGQKKQGAKFYMNNAVHHYVRILTDDNGQPIFQRSIADPLSGDIMGYPYVETIKMPSTDASNTPFINFGNLKYFLVGRRLGSTNISSNPWGAWTTNRTQFKIYQRWALKIGLAEGLVRLITAAS